ncbi:MAG: hypothetical protein U1U88_001511 [Lawsonella clevelandensis]
MDEPCSPTSMPACALRTRADIAELQRCLGTTTVARHPRPGGGHDDGLLGGGLLARWGGWQQVDTPRNLFSTTPPMRLWRGLHWVSVDEQFLLSR